MKAIFEVGDIVRLKSGSGRMVVTRVDYTDSAVTLADVVWQTYAGEQQINMATLPTSALVHDIRQEPESADVPFDQRTQGKYRR